MVDLAGSEHRVDSSEHNAERRKEGAKINASLAALKEGLGGLPRGGQLRATFFEGVVCVAIAPNLVTFRSATQCREAAAMASSTQVCASVV